MPQKLILGIILGSTIGGLLGYVGKACQSSCPFLKDPFRSAIYGALWGLSLGLVSSFIK